MIMFTPSFVLLCKSLVNFKKAIEQGGDHGLYAKSGGSRLITIHALMLLLNIPISVTESILSTFVNSDSDHNLILVYGGVVLSDTLIKKISILSILWIIHKVFTNVEDELRLSMMLHLDQEIDNSKDALIDANNFNHLDEAAE